MNKSIKRTILEATFREHSFALWLFLVTTIMIFPLPVKASPSPESERLLFEEMTIKARQLSEKPHASPENTMPDSLADMSYQQYRSIRFRPEMSLWRGESLFEVQLFHPGFLYLQPVVIKTVEKGHLAPQRLNFDPVFFNYEREASSLANVQVENLGFAGFRIHFPLNNQDYKDEVIVFQGASYFRMVGPGQLYGLSARGLAIDTAAASGEEFAVFKEFWLIKPLPGETRMTILALLDSPSATGAYRFILTPESPTSLEVEARLFIREDIGKLGIAPLTSMFLFGENSVGHMDDFRSEVHDSDGLLVLTKDLEWIWRPLTNPGQLRLSAQVIQNPKGFGLFQRDRDFDHYLDMESHYEKRPSLWVEPLADWGKGHVELVEIPTKTETNDNIVAYWVSEQPATAGTQLNFHYRLTSFNALPHHHDQGHVIRTRSGWGAVPGEPDPPPRSKRQFIVDFTGPKLAELPPELPIRAKLQVSQGTISDLQVSQLPGGESWRVSFKILPDNDRPVDMRMFLTLREQQISEVWNYVWSPKEINE